MNRIGRRTIICMAIIMVALIIPAARAADVDWKFYGGANNDYCFYDLHGAVQRRDDHITVWVKCLPQNAVNAIEVTDGEAKVIADKIVRGYVAPIISVGDEPFDKLPDVAIIEHIANISYIEPHARVFYELDCRGNMLRTLSIQIPGHRGSDRPSEWKFVAPETNAARLVKMTCG
jgi:hypothetical protein